MSETNKCPECKAQLPASAPRGLCPACLLKRGLETNTLGYSADAPAAGRWIPPGIEQLTARFPELEITRLIGRGGMGAVYQARQKNLDRMVALKILPPEIGRDPAFAERFTREAQAMARLSHPHIVTIHEFGQLGARAASPAFSPTPNAAEDGHAPGLYYFLMEYVDGMSLRGLLDSGHISPKEALAIVPQICDALQYAHDQGIVHRDIKPENILLSKQGQVKIADFGLAKLMGRTAVPPVPSPAEGPGHQTAREAAGMPEKIMGTPQYMAPEQLEHPADVDHRADIYSLGVVFYQMLTGELPTGKFAPPSTKVQIDVRLDEIVLRALEKEPEKRYQQVSEVKTQVETITGTAHSEQHAVALRYAADAPERLSAFTGSPRFSRTAIVGVVWMPWAFISFLLMFVECTAVPAGTTPTGPNWFQILAMLVVGGLGITAPFGTTILGWVAVSQIRRSAGRLYGLGLAVFDALFFPLLVIDGLIYPGLGMALQRIINNEFRDSRFYDTASICLSFGLWAMCAVVDFLIIWWVWRAVKKPLDGQTQTPRPLSTGGSGRPRLSTSIEFPRR